MCTTAIYKLYYLILFFSLSKHKANTSELHPKVRQTCLLLICILCFIYIIYLSRASTKLVSSSFVFSGNCACCVCVCVSAIVCLCVRNKIAEIQQIKIFVIFRKIQVKYVANYQSDEQRGTKKKFLHCASPQRQSILQPQNCFQSN